MLFEKQEVVDSFIESFIRLIFSFGFTIAIFCNHLLLEVLLEVVRGEAYKHCKV